MLPVIVDRLKLCYGEFHVVKLDDELFRVDFVKFSKGKPRGKHKGRRLFVNFGDARRFVAEDVIMGFHVHDL